MAFQTKIVWIVGAGFSRSLGAPLLDGLLRLESVRNVGNVFKALVETKGVAAESWSIAKNVAACYLVGAYGLRNNSLFREQHWEHAEEFLERLDRICTLKDGAERETMTDLFHRVQGISHSRLDTIETYTFAGEKDGIERVRQAALWLMAAECCAFLVNANTKLERWMPYTRWAELLDADDTVLTFNYDRVPDKLSGHLYLKDRKAGGLWIPTPDQAMAGAKDLDRLRARVFKMHGSVDWCEMGHDCLEVADGQWHECAALLTPIDRLGMATPGPTKREMVGENGLLFGLWATAKNALKDADAIVFVGYRIPPTDSFTRSWLVENIVACAAERSVRNPAASNLPVHIVLGPDSNSVDVKRLKGLLVATLEGQVEIHVWPMWAEDFLATVDKALLVEPGLRRIRGAF